MINKKINIFILTYFLIEWIKEHILNRFDKCFKVITIKLIKLKLKKMLEKETGLKKLL